MLPEPPQAPQTASAVAHKAILRVQSCRVSSPKCSGQRRVSTLRVSNRQTLTTTCPVRAFIRSWGIKQGIFTKANEGKC
jgi:hypothetical protein